LKALIRTLPRIVAALAFTAATTAAVVLGGAAQAGKAPATPLTAAPQAADAAVFVGVGVGNYPRWRWDGYHRSWVRFGVSFGSPGYIANVGYVGYAPPPGPPYWAVPVVYGRPYFYHRYFRPYYGPYGHAYYRGGYGWHRGGWR